MTSRTRVVLVRHGHALANADGVLGDHDTCRGLSPRGRAEVLALRERLLRTRELADATAVVTSTTRRAVETAALLADAIGDGRPAVQRDCGVCDVHWGALNGQPEASLVAEGPFERVADGGESWLAFMRRARRALRDIARTCAGSTVVVVTHSGIVKSSFPTYGMTPIPAGDPSFAGMTTWVHDDNAGWALVAFDDRAHVAEGATP